MRLLVMPKLLRPMRSHRNAATYAKIVFLLQTTLTPARQSVTRDARMHARCRRGLVARAAGHSGPRSLHCTHAERPQALHAVCCKLEPVHAEAHCWYAAIRRACQSCQRIIQGDLTSCTIRHLQGLSCHVPMKASPANVHHFKWPNSSDNVPFPCADMYRYPKKSVDLVISDDAVMSEVLLAKRRCE
jgi:hypothetical protein